MENLGEKSGEKEVLIGVWLGEGVEKNVVGLGVFSPGLPKSFLHKMKRKLRGEAH